MTLRKAYLECYNAVMTLLIFMAGAILIQKTLLGYLAPWEGVLYSLPCYLVYFAGRALHRKKLFVVIPAGILLTAGLSLFPILLTWKIGILSIIAYVLIPIFTLVLFFMPYISGRNPMGTGRFVSGITLMLAAIIIKGVHHESYYVYLNTAAILFLIVGLFTYNRENLVDATKQDHSGSKVKFPPGMRRNNMVMLVGIILIGLLIANFKTLQVMASDALIYVMYLVVQFFLFLGSLMGIGGEPGGESSGGGDSPMMGGEAAPLNPLVELIVQIFIILVCVAAAALILYFVYRGIRKLISQMPDWLRRLLGNLNAEGETSYIDETEDLLDKGGLRQEFAKSVNDLWDKLTYRAPKFEDMPDNREKVRFVFKHLLKKMYLRSQNVVARTPMELSGDASTLLREPADRFMEAYNQARYGDAEIPDDAAALAKQILKKL